MQQQMADFMEQIKPEDIVAFVAFGQDDDGPSRDVPPNHARDATVSNRRDKGQGHTTGGEDAAGLGKALSDGKPG
jgi:hypothetical protein